MNWRIGFSASSLKFLKQNNLEESFVIDKIKLTLQKFKGESVNINIKKLGSGWKGFHRIRSGQLRIIVEFQFEQNQAYVEEIDWRGNVYK